MKKNSIIALVLTISLALTTTPVLALTTDYTTTRLGGQDRFDTAIEVSKEFAKNDTITNCIIGNCDNYADNISASPLSVYENAPILLTEKDSLNPKTQQRLADMGIKNVFIVGGVGAVSQNVEDQLKSLGYNVTRFGGADRIETNRIIMNFIPKDLWGPYPKVVNAYDWVQGLSVAMDTKFVYTSETVAPFIEGASNEVNYDAIETPDSTPQHRKYVMKRKTIKTTKAYINPIFTVSNTAFKPSDFQDIKGYIDYLYNKWGSTYVSNGNSMTSIYLADVDENLFTNAVQDAISRYNRDYAAGIKVRPGKYEEEAMTITGSTFKDLNQLSACYWAAGDGTTKAPGNDNNISTNLSINRMYNDSNIGSNNYKQRQLHKFSTVMITKYDNFIDALSVSTLSAKYSIPMVLIDKSLDKMPNVYTHIESKPMAPTVDSYKDVNKVYYIGGTEVLPDGSEKFLSK